MRSTEVKVILDRFEDLKQYSAEKFAEINDKLDLQCNNCTNAVELRSSTRFQWWNITAIWSTLGGMVLLFFKHVGK